MMCMFIIHPRNPTGPKADRDFALMLSEWRIDVGTMRPNPIEMTDFKVFTLNARAFPGTAPLVAKYGERVRIRFGQLKRHGTSPNPYPWGPLESRWNRRRPHPGVRAIVGNDG